MPTADHHKDKNATLEIWSPCHACIIHFQQHHNETLSSSDIKNCLSQIVPAHTPPLFLDIQLGVMNATAHVGYATADPVPLLINSLDRRQLTIGTKAIIVKVGVERLDDAKAAFRNWKAQFSMVQQEDFKSKFNFCGAGGDMMLRLRN